MAALLEKVRDYQKHPVMSAQEQDEQFGTYTPTRLRASLPNAQRQAIVKPAPKNVVPAEKPHATNAARFQAPQTDDDERGTHPTAPAPRRRVQTDEPKPRVRFPWKQCAGTLCAVAGIGTILYTLVFLIVLLVTSLGTLWSFGPIHTSYNHTRIDGQPATIISSNDNGHITITVSKQQASGTWQAQSYQGPELSADAWNNDLAAITTTSNVARDGKTILITLTGNINYFHLFFTRPSMTFRLVPDDHQGYTVVSS